MEGLSASVLENAFYQGSYCYNEKFDTLETTEIWPVQTSLELRRRQIPAVSAGLWSSDDTSGGTKAAALLRVVWLQRIRRIGCLQLDARQSSLDTVLENFQIEDAYEDSFAVTKCFTLVRVHQTAKSDTLTFSLCMPSTRSSFGVAWKYDFRSERTEAVCWADDWVLEKMQKVMSQQKRWARHPLFLALVASITVGNALDLSLGDQGASVSAVERRTKFHGLAHNSAEIAQGDYALLSQRMSGSATSLAADERIYKVLSEVLGDIALYSQRYYVNNDPSSENMRLEVEACVETLKKRLKMQKIQLDFVSRRVDVQLTALFNLIAQKEARLSVAVAEDSRTLASASRNDSTAMKTLAAMTIAFLPGTFIAALFAVPIFKWDAVGEDKVISKRFWVYWAVTVPLTFLTLLFWVLWTRRQARTYRLSQRRAREDIWSHIEWEGDGGAEEKEVPV